MKPPVHSCWLGARSHPRSWALTTGFRRGLLRAVGGPTVPAMQGTTVCAWGDGGGEVLITFLQDETTTTNNVDWLCSSLR